MLKLQVQLVPVHQGVVQRGQVVPDEERLIFGIGHKELGVEVADAKVVAVGRRHRGVGADHQRVARCVEAHPVF